MLPFWSLISGKVYPEIDKHAFKNYRLQMIDIETLMIVKDEGYRWCVL